MKTLRKGVQQFPESFSLAQVAYADEGEFLFFLRTVAALAESADIDKVRYYDRFIGMFEIGSQILLQQRAYADNLLCIFVGSPQCGRLSGRHLPAVDGRSVFRYHIRDAVAFIDQVGRVSRPCAEVGMYDVRLAVAADVAAYQQQCQQRPDETSRTGG